MRKTLSWNYGLELGHDRIVRRGFFPYLKLWCFRFQPGYLARMSEGYMLRAGQDFSGIYWDISPVEWLHDHIIWRQYTFLIFSIVIPYRLRL